MQIADHTIVFAPIGGLMDEVSAEQQARADLMSIQPADSFVACEGRFGADIDWETEPAWGGVGSRLREEEEVL